MDGNGTTGYAQLPFLTFVKPAEVCLWYFGSNTSSLYLALFQYSCYVLFSSGGSVLAFPACQGEQRVKHSKLQEKGLVSCG